MTTLITAFHIITCVFIVLVVLIQSGKGAEISASLGGSSQTVFGSSGGANFFVKLTWILAIVFAITSLGLTIAGNRAHKSLFSKPLETAAPQAPTPPIQPSQATPEAPKEPVNAKPTQ